MKSNLLRVVVIASVDGLYSQIHDEIYCGQEQYNQIFAEFGYPNKYKVIKV